MTASNPYPAETPEAHPRRHPLAHHPLVRGLELLLLAVAIACFGIVFFTLTESWFYQTRGRWQLERAASSEGRELAQAEVIPIEEVPAAPTLKPGQAVGTIAIPEAGVDAVILEGISNAVLRRGVGHFPGTPLPGAGGNFALAGHRDTFFRGLEDVRVGHRVEVTTPAGTLTYHVVHTEIIEPTAVEVLDPQDQETLTLITCYPFRFVGAAPQRYLVRAHREPLPETEEPEIAAVQTRG